MSKRGSLVRPRLPGEGLPGLCALRLGAVALQFAGLDTSKFLLLRCFAEAIPECSQR